MIGIQGTKRNEKGEDVWGFMGCATLRAIIESAYGILPKDESPQAQQKRMLQDISSINGLICIVKVGIDVDPTGEHPDRNKITGIITPDMAIYRKLIGQLLAICLNGLTVNGDDYDASTSGNPSAKTIRITFV
jgi:hypothetical protein